MVGELVFLLRCGFDERAARDELRAARVPGACQALWPLCFRFPYKYRTYIQG